MFSIEATATYYATSHYWGAFFCATIGAFVSRELGYEKYAAFSPHFSALPYKQWEILLFLGLSVACGALGGLFVKLFTCAAARGTHPLRGVIATTPRRRRDRSAGTSSGFDGAARRSTPAPRRRR